MKKPLMFRVLIIITLILAMGLSGCTPAGNDTEKTKIAFIYVGPVGDGGWTYAHNLGRLALEEEVPNLEVTILESIPENPVDVGKSFN